MPVHDWLRAVPADRRGNDTVLHAARGGFQRDTQHRHAAHPWQLLSPLQNGHHIWRRFIKHRGDARRTQAAAGFPSERDRLRACLLPGEKIAHGNGQGHEGHNNPYPLFRLRLVNRRNVQRVPLRTGQGANTGNRTIFGSE